MTRKLRLLGCIALILPMGVASAGVFPQTLDETLVELRADYRPPYQKPREGQSFLSPMVLRLEADSKKARSFDFLNRMSTLPYFPAYCVTTNAFVSFAYRSDMPAKMLFAFGYMNNRIGMKELYPRIVRTIEASSDWRNVCLEFPVPRAELCTPTLCLQLAAGSGFVEVRDFRVAEGDVPQGGLPLMLGGAPAKEIVLLRTNDLVRARAERRAAQMIRFALSRAGLRTLPIREVGEIGEASTCAAVLVGALAERRGMLDGASLDLVHARLGSGAWAVRGTCLGVTGNCPAGPQYAVCRLLDRLGVEYLASDAFWIRSPGSFSLADGESFAHAPATPYRLSMRRSGTRTELKGFISDDDIYGNLGAGTVEPWTNNEKLCHDSLGFIVTLDEFAETHPEYFALQESGDRFSKTTDRRGDPRGVTQFCWTDPGLQRTVAERYLEIMRATPYQTMYKVAPGDGAGRFCHCARCRACGNTSDGLLTMANAVADVTSKVFPDKRIFISSYVDTVAAPTRVTPHPNVKAVTAFPYHYAYWSASNFYRHEANARGVAAIEDWRKVFPDQSPELFAMCCREWMNVWPAYGCVSQVFSEFAAHGAFFSDNSYWNPEHNGNPGSCSFVDLCLYVAMHYSFDPDWNEKKGLSHYFSAYYGPAARPMAVYFKALNAYLVERDWRQNTERIRRGFITPEFAAQVLPLLDEAERLAGEGGDFLGRVFKEKQRFLFSYLYDVNRAQANIPAGGLKAWAERLAEFIRICTHQRCTYMIVNPQKWLYEIAFLSIRHEDFSRDWSDPAQPDIARFLADPLRALEKSIPVAQERTARGWRLPIAKMVGGHLSGEDTPEGRIKVVQLWRPSSGCGRALAGLQLESAPKKNVKMVLRGIDCEKSDVAVMAVEINGRRVVEGPVPFGKKQVERREFTIPAKAFRKGVNEVVLCNLTSDKTDDPLCGAAFDVAQNYMWGWWEFADPEFEFQ